MLQKVKICFNCESNTGPQDLQSCALPTELLKQIGVYVWPHFRRSVYAHKGMHEHTHVGDTISLRNSIFPQFQCHKAVSLCSISAYQSLDTSCWLLDGDMFLTCQHQQHLCAMWGLNTRPICHYSQVLPPNLITHASCLIEPLRYQLLFQQWFWRVLHWHINVTVTVIVNVIVTVIVTDTVTVTVTEYY